MADPTTEGREVAWLRRLRDLSHRMSEEWDARKLLPVILDAAIELSGAERGYLVIVTGRTERGGCVFDVVEARGFDQAELRGAEGKVSRTVVRRVMDEATSDGLVTTREQDLLEVSSIQARQVVAIASVPLRRQGQTRGVLYLDHRRDPRAFSPTDLPVLQAFADQAALALSTAEALAERSRSTEALDAALADLRAARAALDVYERPSAVSLERASFGRLVGSSPVMRALYEEVERVATARGPVLVLGEPGVGKETVALEVHARGPEAAAAFTMVPCASATVEADVFGVWSPAEGRGRLGALGAPGTVVLDEVSDLAPALQARLLQAMQTGMAQAGGRSTPVRARVLATSHHDLQTLVREGRFRADLFYRLDVLRLVIPPLRDRRGDIPLLIEQFARQVGRRLIFTPRALELLMGYAWPGNVRQLANETQRLLFVPEPQLTGVHLSPEVREGRGVTTAPARLAGKTLEDVERTMVEAALRECRGNKARTARQLGIPRSTLYGLLVRYGLDES